MVHLAAVLGAIGAPLVLATGRRATILAGIALIALAEAGLATSGPTGFSPSHGVLGLAGLSVAAVVAIVFVRRPELVPLVLLIAAPFRMPLDIGGAHRFYVGLPADGQIGRLLPLYGFVAAAAIALAWRLVRRDDLPLALPREIAIPVGAFVAFASLSVLWSSADAAAQNLLQYFLLPFALIVAVAARSPFPTWMPRAMGIAAVAIGGLLATIGLIEVATHRLLFYSPAVEVGNAYSSFFRVTSLFRDPSMYGRHLVIAIAIVLTAVWYRRLGMLLATGIVVFLFAGLFFSYSQSSFVALFMVALFVTVVAGDRTVRVAAVAVAVVVVASGTAFVADKVAGASTQRVTSDRSRRIDLTKKVFVQHPVAGVGLGSQPSASQAVSRNGGPPTLFVSHTTPLTVAAELGIVGILLYAAVLLGAAKALLRVYRLEAAFGVALAAVFVTLFVHSLFYAGFFEDPVTWLVLGIASSFLAARATTARDPA